jgi:hypothetical protein
MQWRRASSSISGMAGDSGGVPVRASGGGDCGIRGCSACRSFCMASQWPFAGITYVLSCARAVSSVTAALLDGGGCNGYVRGGVRWLSVVCLLVKRAHTHTSFKTDVYLDPGSSTPRPGRVERCTNANRQPIASTARAAAKQMKAQVAALHPAGAACLASPLIIRYRAGKGARGLVFAGCQSGSWQLHCYDAAKPRYSDCDAKCNFSAVSHLSSISSVFLGRAIPRTCQ